MTAAIEISGLSRRYGSVTALQPTDLSIAPGQFVTLLGPSGSGKSTLLAMLAGLLEPSGGRIRIAGRDVTETPAHARNIGMVFQGYALFPHMTVGENVAFPLRMRATPERTVAAGVTEALEMVQLGHLAARYPSELSGGQQQRVALARALVHRPAVILMDEPLSALDKKLREQMQFELRRIHAAIGATIIYVTHDQQEAMTMSDRICVLRDGSILQDAAPDRVYFEPANRFVAEFIGESNILPVSLIERDGGLLRLRLPSGEEVRAPEADAAEQAEAEIMIRPERVTIVAEDASAENAIAATISEVVLTGGLTRLIFRTAWGQPLSATWLTDRGMARLTPGTEVRLGWRVADTVVLRKADP